MFGVKSSKAKLSLILIGLGLILTRRYKLPNNQERRSNFEDINHQANKIKKSVLKNDELIQEVEADFIERSSQIQNTCKKFGSRLKVPLKLYNKKLRSEEAKLF